MLVHPVSSLVIILASITLLVWMFRKLRFSEERFRLLAENSGDLVCLHDLNGDYTYVSPASERSLGYASYEMVHEIQNPQKRMCVEDQKAFQAMLMRLQNREDATGSLTYQMEKKTGGYIWFETFARLLVDEQGQPQAFLTSSRDVTDRKNAEDMYRYLAANLPDTGVVVYDEELRVHIAEGQIIGRYGWTQSLIEGRQIPHIIGPTFAAVSTEYFYATLAGKAQDFEIPFEGCFYRVQLLPMYVGSRVTGGMVMLHDITAQKIHEQEIREQTSELERSNRDLEQFADIASHELRAPLRHISGFAELLAEEHEGLISDEADTYLTHIMEGAQEMQRVIEALLQYSRAKTNESRMQSVNLRPLMRQVLDSIQLRMVSVGGRVDVLWETMPTLLGDPVLLKQMLENLVWNGLKFSGHKPYVRVSCVRELVDWVISIEDNGPGVDSDHAQMIFQMFKRSRTDVEGSGVGLALCKKIAGIHRGKIWVEKGSGPADRPGALFRVSLPARIHRREITVH